MTKSTWSTKHQLQSSPGSNERTTGWLSWRAWRLAWRLGEESQQPTLPQVWHIRRWTHQLPVSRHSSQPATGPCGSVSLIWSRWVQTTMGHPSLARSMVPVQLQAEREVLLHRHVRVQGVVLENMSQQVCEAWPASGLPTGCW